MTRALYNPDDLPISINPRFMNRNEMLTFAAST